MLLLLLFFFSLAPCAEPGQYGADGTKRTRLIGLFIGWTVCVYAVWTAMVCTVSQADVCDDENVVVGSRCGCGSPTVCFPPLILSFRNSIGIRTLAAIFLLFCYLLLLLLSIHPFMSIHLLETMYFLWLPFFMHFSFAPNV